MSEQQKFSDEWYAEELTKLRTKLCKLRARFYKLGDKQGNPDWKEDTYKTHILETAKQLNEVTAEIAELTDKTAEIEARHATEPIWQWLKQHRMLREKSKRLRLQKAGINMTIIEYIEYAKLNFKKLIDWASKNKAQAFLFVCITIVMFLLLLILLSLQTHHYVEFQSLGRRAIRR